LLLVWVEVMDEAAAETFNSFPVAARGYQLWVLDFDWRDLSILSQLLPSGCAE
jgi:hypothetical protein